jgi:hypothetical protein
MRPHDVPLDRFTGAKTCWRSGSRNALLRHAHAFPMQSIRMTPHRDTMTLHGGLGEPSMGATATSALRTAGATRKIPGARVQHDPPCTCPQRLRVNRIRLGRANFCTLQTDLRCGRESIPPPDVAPPPPRCRFCKQRCPNTVMSARTCVIQAVREFQTHGHVSLRART